MATTYDEFSEQTTSEKIVLCHIEPAERLLVWTLDSGAIYTRTTDYFVIDVKIATTSLAEASSSTLSAGEWFYEIETGVCYVRMTDDSNPNTKDVVGYYRQFFANAPINLPYDLLSGAEVPYLPYLKNNSAIKKELDEEQTGISLEAATKLTLENTDGYFDNTYDTLFYENKFARLYSWNPKIVMSEKRTLFSGEIQDKTFSPSVVTFNCKDFMYKLREKVSLSLFSSSDGSVADSILATPKRRIYGKVDNVQCVGIDNILNGYALTGTISGGGDSAAITGAGTLFLDELSPGDDITITLLNETIETSVESVTDDTNLVLSDEVVTGFLGQSVIIKPDRPWRKKNRNWHVAGHKLREPTTTVASASQPNRITLTDGSDIFDNDLIDIDGFDVNVKRIVGNDVVLRQNIPAGTPSGGEAVTKNPVSKAYINQKESFINTDWTLSNSTEAILNFTELAEFNLAARRVLPGSNTFSNGSRTVMASGVNFTDYVQSRDWVQSDDITHTTWYEVLTVDESNITLRIAYAGANNTGASYMKLPELLDDNSLVTVNCIGYENGSGEWVKTASDSVRHLLENDSVIVNLNAASFTQSDADAPYIVSMVIPESISSDAPKINSVINKLNESVFGSLVTNSSFDLVYNILTPEKPETLEAIEQHDIIGEPSVRSRNEIIRKVNLKYRPFVDRFTGEDSFLLIEHTSDFVDNYIGARQEKDVTVFLYNTLDADVIAQRIALYNSLSQSVVTVKAKLNLSSKSLNDKIYINLDRIYKRFGGRDRRKIGVINKVSTDGANSVVEFNDLANIFNRVMSIAPDAASAFTSATDTEKIFNTYVCDDDLEVPDTSSDQELGSNIIG